jgi:hypothetical protein
MYTVFSFPKVHRISIALLWPESNPSVIISLSIPRSGMLPHQKTPRQQRSSDPKPSIQTDEDFQRHASFTSFSLAILQVNFSFSFIYSPAKNLSHQVFPYNHHQHVGHEEDLYLQLYGSWVQMTVCLFWDQLTDQYNSCWPLRMCISLNTLLILNLSTRWTAPVHQQWRITNMAE